jgi:hypothetical protein
MTQVWHIFAKDLRYLRRPLIAWLALLLLSTLGSAAKARMVPTEGVAQALTQVGWLITAATSLMSVVLVVMLVHADPLVGVDGFWCTRPISRHALFASKLAFAMVFVALPGLVAQTLWSAAAGMLPGDLLLAVPETLLIEIVRIGLLMCLACLGSSVWRVLVSVVGPPVLIVLLVLLFTSGEPRHTHLEAALPVLRDPSPLIATCVLLAFGMPAIVWGYYHSRDRGGSVLLGVVLVVVAITTPAWFPSSVSFVGSPPRITEAWALDPTMTKPRLASDRFERSTLGGPPGGGRNDRLISIAGPVVLDGVPASYVAMPYTLSASIRFDDGVSVAGRRSYPQTVQVSAEREHPSLRWIGTGDRQELLRPNVRWETWPVLLEARAEDLERERGHAGRYTGSFRYLLYRFDRVATLPLRAGADYRERANGLRVIDATSRPDGCHAMVKTTRVSLAIYGAAPQVLSYQVAHRNGRPAGERRNRLGGLSDPLFERFSMSDSARYPVSVDFTEVTAFDAPACNDLNLLVDRSQVAGELTRTLELPHFQPY